MKKVVPTKTNGNDVLSRWRVLPRLKPEIREKIRLLTSSANAQMMKNHENELRNARRKLQNRKRRLKGCPKARQRGPRLRSCDVSIYVGDYGAEMAEKQKVFLQVSGHPAVVILMTDYTTVGFFNTAPYVGTREHHVQQLWISNRGCQS